MLLSREPEIQSLLLLTPKIVSCYCSFVLRWWIITIRVRSLATSVRTIFVCLSGLQPNSIHRLVFSIFNSGTREHLARRGWYIHVSLPALPRLSSRLLMFRTPLHLAGNSLLPLTLSGMSFEGGAHGDGQYGSVVFSLVSCLPPTAHWHNKGLIFTWFRFTHLRAWQPL
jgi:hypothetical protein